MIFDENGLFDHWDLPDHWNNVICCSGNQKWWCPCDICRNHFNYSLTDALTGFSGSICGEIPKYEFKKEIIKCINGRN